MMLKTNEPISLYIHIPFCHEKCYYCDFLSFPKGEHRYDGYVSVLIQEIKEKALAYNAPIKSIFIGGGTPTVLSISQMQAITAAIHSSFTLLPGYEWSIEANPESSIKEKLSIYRREGINRISFGLQAWQNRLLQSIGRIHTREMFLQCFHNARAVGFQNINIDLMFSLPGQSIKDWTETLENVNRLSPEHISCYSLTIEEGTPFDTMLQDRKITLPDEDQDRQMYALIPEFLPEYEQYEISNFCKPGFSCRHNLVYWQGGNYLGLGLGAHSYVDGMRFHNTESLQEYLTGGFQPKNFVSLTVKDKMAEFMFLRLRLKKGFTEAEFADVFQKTVWAVYQKEMAEMLALGLLYHDKQNGRIFLTAKGIDLSNQVFMAFMPD